MKVLLIRSRYRADGIFGEFKIYPGGTVCQSLEHAYQNADGTYSPKIPAGVYQCSLRHSPKFERELYEVKNVPGHTDILIHAGNYNEDSDGCILIGQGLGRKLNNGFMITSSIKALENFMAIEHGADFDLTIEDDK
jgi:hypothetical protein